MAAGVLPFNPSPIKILSADSPLQQRYCASLPPPPPTTISNQLHHRRGPFALSTGGSKNIVGAIGGIFGRPASAAFQVRAVTDDDEWGKEAPEKDSPGGVAVVEEDSEPATEIRRNLKKNLKNQLYGTDRGLRVSSETQAEIVELITQLEAENPTPAPTEALALLNGRWILAYTSFSQLFPLLAAAGRVPLQLVEVEEISQTIDSEALTVQNSVRFAGPLATTSVTTNAKFEVRGPKRVQIKFEEGIIGTPQLTDSIITPDKVEFLGQNIDLSPIKGVLSSIQDVASSVARTISDQPPLKIPITSTDAQSWLLTTYLDDELRISRGDGGSVFVLVKEGSSLID